MTTYATEIDPNDDLVARVAAVRDGRTTAASRVEDALARIAKVNPTLNAFHEDTAEDARATAAAVDARLSSGEDAGPLAGAIVAIKDNICTTAGRTTCSSRMLAEYRSPYEATAVDYKERYNFGVHRKAWGGAHTGPGIRFTCMSDAIDDPDHKGF